MAPDVSTAEALMQEAARYAAQLTADQASSDAQHAAALTVRLAEQQGEQARQLEAQKLIQDAQSRTQVKVTLLGSGLALLAVVITAVMPQVFRSAEHNPGRFQIVEGAVPKESVEQSQLKIPMRVDTTGGDVWFLVWSKDAGVPKWHRIDVHESASPAVVSDSGPRSPTAPQSSSSGASAASGDGDARPQPHR